ncbi:methyltransferase-like protein 2 isoform X1 [Typha angustifolia]|uniref:methyltransferase-like protein 2 isoform X1 n=1 Tax=Typha angustifolia TaxID=59011 RepID=UPI003C2E07E0
MEHSFFDELKSFMESGIYPLLGSTVVFLDPVRLLNESYSRFTISPSAYYSRRFDSNPNGDLVREGEAENLSESKKRKRKRKPKLSDLNEREREAEKRHQDARPLLLRAHRALLEASDLLGMLSKIIDNGSSSHCRRRADEVNFVELGKLWQAPLFEMSLCSRAPNNVDEGVEFDHCVERTVIPLFNNLISNEANDDAEAKFQSSRYILPSRSCFQMSDLRQVRDLIPDKSNEGFNLIVIDPPWENGSVHQKAAYPTLPNKYFLYLPVKELAHTEGALVALWMTNREKLRIFVEKELFPAWGVTDAAIFYWMKVKPDGSLICDLDSFHHRPYECLLLGYVNVNVDSECLATHKCLRSIQVIVSVPGAHSRKPPLGKLLLEHIPGPKPAKCIELFAREMVAGWTSWGNEPLHFQDSTYFLEKEGNIAPPGGINSLGNN